MSPLHRRCTACSSASTGPRFLLGSLPSFMTEHILQIETSRLFVGAQKLAQGLKLTVPSPTLPQSKLSAPPRAALPRFQRGSAVCQPHPATYDGALCQYSRRRVATNQPVSPDPSRQGVFRRPPGHQPLRHHHRFCPPLPRDACELPPSGKNLPSQQLAICLHGGATTLPPPAARSRHHAREPLLRALRRRAPPPSPGLSRTGTPPPRP